MLVQDWMRPQPDSLPGTATVAHARALLAESGGSYLAVVERDRVVGLVGPEELDAAPATPLTAAMQVADVVIGAHEPLRHAADAMQQRHMRAMPVLRHGRLAGLITSTDCRRAERGGLASGPTIQVAVPFA